MNSSQSTRDRMRVALALIAGVLSVLAGQSFAGPVAAAPVETAAAR